MEAFTYLELLRGFAKLSIVISSDGDDQIVAKNKSQQIPKGFQQNPLVKTIGPKINPIVHSTGTVLVAYQIIYWRYMSTARN